MVTNSAADRAAVLHDLLRVKVFADAPKLAGFTDQSRQSRPTAKLLRSIAETAVDRIAHLVAERVPDVTADWGTNVEATIEDWFAEEAPLLAQDSAEMIDPSYVTTLSQNIVMQAKSLLEAIPAFDS